MSNVRLAELLIISSKQIGQFAQKFDTILQQKLLEKLICDIILKKVIFLFNVVFLFYFFKCVFV